MSFETKIIEFKGMPLFQKAKFKVPIQDMEGSIMDFACFFYMVKGKMLSFDSRGVTVLGEKEAILKNCNNYIQRYVPDTLTDECEAVAVYLYPELLKEIYKEEVPTFLQDIQIPERKKMVSNVLIEQYIANLILYFENPDIVDEKLGILKLKELMIILLKSQDHENIRRLLSEIFTPVHVEFKKAIEQNLFNDLSIEQLAFICHMSLSSFKREFKKVFNDTPARYIKDRRLERAASLLLCGDEPISQVAYDCGFQDPTTFSDSFHKKYNASPKNFRLNKSRS